MMFKRAIIAILVQLVFPAAAIAQQTASPSGEEWYKVVTGVIAIPAAILGVIISWNMVRKTRLETRKLQIDIDEKQKVLLSGEMDKATQLIAEPFSDNQRALLIIIRFVLLELTLRIWNFIPDVVQSIIGFAGAGFLFLFHGGGTGAVVIAAIMPQILNSVLSIVYWIIVFGFGWPLFKDTCSFLNIPIKSLLDVPMIARRRNH
jgi:hypothetical protein